MPERPLQCPWANYPSHARNRQLQVDGTRPLVSGYCASHETCGSCAGTTFKPNILLQQGRGFEFVPCPYCSPAEFRRRVARWQDKGGRP